ncbi:MAG: metal ABC transporter permease [Gemmatimonadota bacterium]|nr:MAG: metal ABC transporter permease [Gemmatimonadota bacterium]
MIAFLFTAKPGKLIAIAYSTDTLAAIAGLYASYETDLPTGPTVVCTFALALLSAFALSQIKRRVPSVSGATAE